MSHITREVEAENEEQARMERRQRRIEEFLWDSPLGAPIRPEGFDQDGNPIW
jgi:hypothetical protein